MTVRWVGTVVTMSGLPAHPGDSFPARITTVWSPRTYGVA